MDRSGWLSSHSTAECANREAEREGSGPQVPVPALRVPLLLA